MIDCDRKFARRPDGSDPAWPFFQNGPKPGDPKGVDSPPTKVNGEWVMQDPDMFYLSGNCRYWGLVPNGSRLVVSQDYSKAGSFDSFKMESEGDIWAAYGTILDIQDSDFENTREYMEMFAEVYLGIMRPAYVGNMKFYKMLYTALLEREKDPNNRDILRKAINSLDAAIDKAVAENRR